METYYEVLEIQKDASKQDIKKAYFKLVRKYNPEKNTNEFMEIRKAYETLSDEKTKSEYDRLMAVSPEIRKVLENVELLKRVNNFKQAIKELEAIVKNGEKSEYILNELAELYIKDGKIGKATKIYEQIVENSPENAAFTAKLAKCYLERGWRKKAITMGHKAIELDKDNLSAWRELISAHILGEEFLEAEQLTSQAFIGHEEWDRNQFYSILMNGAIASGSKYLLNNTLNDMVQYAKEKLNTSIYNEVQQSIKGMLITIGKMWDRLDVDFYIDIVKNELPNFAYINEIENCMKINQRMHKDIINLNLFSNFIFGNELSDEMMTFIDLHISDPRIFLEADELKELEEKYVKEAEACGMEDLETFNKDIVGSYMHILKISMLMNNKEMKKDVQILKKEFTLIYNEFKEFFDLAFASENKRHEYLYKTIVLNVGNSINEQVINQNKNIGRNDPCPCGSGKKYKKCCGA